MILKGKIVIANLYAYNQKAKRPVEAVIVDHFEQGKTTTRREGTRILIKYKTTYGWKYTERYLDEVYETK